MKTLIIAQIDISFPISSMTNYGAGIWWKKLTMTPDEQAASPLVTVLSADLSAINETPLNVASVSVGIEQYTGVSSLSEMYLQPKSWLWDNANQIIWIRFDDPYWIKGSLTAGNIKGFIDKAQADSAGFPTDAIIGSVYYEPDLIASSINVSMSVDALEYGIFQHDKITFNIDNTNGKYDTLNADSAGLGVRLFYASCEDDERIEPEDFEIMRRGFVEAINFTGRNVATVNGVDARKKWTDKINTEIFTKTEYAQLKDADVDKRKPLCLGPCYNVPCVQIATTTPTFMFTTDSYGDADSVTQVYVDGVATSHAGTETDGTFTIAGYTSGKVTADVVGVDKGNDVEKILWLLEEFKTLGYVSTNFNISEINLAKTLCKTGSLYIGTSGEELKSVIERLLVNMGGWIIQQGDVFTIRIYDADKVSSRIIYNDELSAFPDLSYNQKQFFTSVTVRYHKDETEKTYYTYYDNSEELTASQNQKRLSDKEIITTLLTEADAIAIADRFYPRFLAVPATLKLPLETSIQGLFPTDVITFEHYRNIIDSAGTVTKSVIIARANYMITDINWISRVITATYMTANPEPVYTVKYMYNDKMYNDKMYA